MTDPVLPLRAALRAACLVDGPLAALVGAPPTLHDEPPRGAAPVYATFGPAACRDWSDTGGAGHEQELALVVWAAPGSAASGLAAAARLAALLDGANLPLAGHRLVALTWLGTETDRDPETRLGRTVLRLRAVTEVEP